MELTNEIKKDLALWVSELRSGKWKQTQRHLQLKDSFCCLGIACKLFIPEDKQDLSAGRLFGGMPQDQKNSPNWLNIINQDCRKKTGNSLSGYNDGGMNFIKIANIIEKTYLK